MLTHMGPWWDSEAKPEESQGSSMHICNLLKATDRHWWEELYILLLFISSLQELQEPQAE